jgi:ABC-type Na+ transport system ATPase subunit NatA
MINIKELCLKKKIPEISHLNLRVNAGESYVLLSTGDTALDHLTNIFSGLERDFKGIVEIDDIDIRANRDCSHKNIVLLNSGSQWPRDMKVGHMISFFKKTMNIPEDEFEELNSKLRLDTIHQKRISDLEEVEWRRILFSMVQLKKSKNYIFRDFARGMPLDFNIEFKRSVHQMRNNGCTILYLSNDVFFAPEIGDRIGFLKKGKLLLELKASKMKKLSLRELYFKFLVER